MSCLLAAQFAGRFSLSLCCGLLLCTLAVLVLLITLNTWLMGLHFRPLLHHEAVSSLDLKLLSISFILLVLFISCMFVLCVFVVCVCVCVCVTLIQSITDFVHLFLSLSLSLSLSVPSLPLSLLYLF